MRDLQGSFNFYRAQSPLQLDFLPVSSPTPNIKPREQRSSGRTDESIVEKRREERGRRRTREEAIVEKAIVEIER
jgi:hypothetical protein